MNSEAIRTAAAPNAVARAAPARIDGAPARASAAGRDQRTGLRILVVDDDRTLREGCVSVLRLDGHDVTSAGRGDEALDVIRRAPFDLLLVDVQMTVVSGTDILKAALHVNPDALVVMMTGNPSVQSSVDVLRAGAWDYLPKPFSGAHLQVLVGRAAYTISGTPDRRQAHPELPDGDAGGDRRTLLGVSPSFRRVVDLARKVAQTDASVMLVGESGTGKELIAQFVHRQSRRARNALVPLNCAAVPEHLLESEMFGHKRGSFTGADRDKVGLLEVAHNGTFFLDELTEMPLTLQAKLLRVVQDGVVRRVGSEQQDAVVDVRFISATNRDPRAAIRTRTLREDLFYRLNVFLIVLPPLRDRVEDIPILAKHFLEVSWRRYHSARTAMPTFGDAAMDLLQCCPWRGNVRELQNVVEHAAVLADTGREIGPDEIQLPNEPENGRSLVTLNDTYRIAKEHVLAQFEKEYVTRLVARSSGNMSRAARLASVDRTTLYRLFERNGYRRDVTDTRGLAPSTDAVWTRSNELDRFPVEGRIRESDTGR